MEKVLIKGSYNEEKKKRIKYIMIACLIVSVILFIALAFDYPHEEKYYGYQYRTYYSNGYYLAFNGGIGCLLMFWGAVFLFIITFPLFMMYRAMSCSLEVTETQIKGISKGGEQVVLPVSKITSYSVNDRISGVTIRTQTGFIAFDGIENYRAIGKVIAELVEKNEKMEKPVQVVEQTSNAMDDLAKLKGLLDSGVITQEEFDAKKKQLLGL